MADRLGLRTTARFAGAHAALLAAIWLTAVVVYSLVFVGATEPAWLTIDAGVISGCIAVVWRNWNALGVRVVTAKQLALIVAFASACILGSQLVIGDRSGVWLDERNYLATLRTGEILRHGVAPFNMRWLAPFLAGAWNALPVSDMDALKAINFGALVVTAVYLTLLLLRLSVQRRLALAAPMFLVCSYLGTYAATNRLVLDPFNYAMFVLLVHALVRPEDGRYVPWLLLVTACNSEKAVYWIPLIAVIALVRRERPWTWRYARESVVFAVKCGGPTLLYLAGMAFYLRGSTTPNEAGTFPQQLYRMAFSSLSAKIDDPTVIATTSQMLWFPFGAFTIYTLLGLVYCERWIKTLVLMLVPIMAQTLIAHDTERMTAYAFVVYLPIGMLYLTRAFEDLPKRLASVLFGAVVALAIAEHYLLPLALVFRQHGLVFASHVTSRPGAVRLILSAAEVLLVGAIVWLHLAVYAPDSATTKGRTWTLNGPGQS